MMMMNFARMFGFASSRIDELIDRNAPIEDILNEQYILQDLQLPNIQTKLLNYIKDTPNILHTLIGYIVNVPHEQLEEYYKFPFIASEILSRENEIFLDFLFEEENLNYIYQLFQLLQNDTLEVTQAGYFAKIILSILRRRHQQLVNIMNKQTLSNLLKHIDITQIAEVIEKIIFCDQVTHPEKSPQLLRRVMNIALYRYFDDFTIDNCLMIINNILKQQQEITQLIEPLFDPFFFLKINYQSSRQGAYELIINLLQLMKTSNDNKQKYLIFQEVAKYLPQVLGGVDMTSLPFENTFGELIYPLTNKCLVFEIYYLMLETYDQNILEILKENESFKIASELIIKFQFNNTIQVWYFKIVNLILTKIVSQQEQCLNIIQKLLIQYNRNEKITVGKLKNKIKPGFQGIMTQVANIVLNSQQVVSQDLNQYAEEILKEINEIENRYLCDVDPKPKQQIFYYEPHQQPQYQQVEVEADDDQDQFYDCHDVNNDNEPKEEDLDEYITSPETKVEDVAQIIDQELQLDANQDPVVLETKLDHQVNEFWKSHDDKEHS